MADATERKKERLWKLCKAFVEERKISCPETVWQCDWVTDDIEGFIDKMAKIVGYAKPDDGE